MNFINCSLWKGEYIGICFDSIIMSSQGPEVNRVKGACKGYTVICIVFSFSKGQIFVIFTIKFETNKGIQVT